MFNNKGKLGLDMHPKAGSLSVLYYHNLKPAKTADTSFKPPSLTCAWHPLVWAVLSLSDVVGLEQLLTGRYEATFPAVILWCFDLLWCYTTLQLCLISLVVVSFCLFFLFLGRML